jgi:2-succinyl-5-enolpyruvyl-6-hydroxy-3-cyclohexene-1-carboxylate synthase
MRVEFLQTLWARLLVRTIARAGVSHAVVTPGSRSTPLLAALIGEPRIRTHRVLDERSAGFLGIGLARSAGQPVLLLCTSGTAAANYMPAIVEADESGIPLVALTADRPIEAQYARSAQTTDQIQLYGRHVRRYVELGEAPTATEAWLGLRRLVSSAVQTALTPQPGPVHLNARARKPLEPCEAVDDAERALEGWIADLLGQAPPRVVVGETTPDPALLREAAEALARCRRGLIICGYDAETPPLDALSLAEFASVTGFPVWLDVTHPLRWNCHPALERFVIRCPQLLWGCDPIATEFAPELIVQVGAPPTSSRWETGAHRARIQRHVVLARHGWPDPPGRASDVIHGDPSKSMRSLAQGVLAALGSPRPREAAWYLQWRHVDTRAERALSQWVGAKRLDNELHAVRAVFEACPAGTCVVLGNSLPVREADLAWPAGAGGLEAFAIRGANGIDGVLSTAVGVARGGARPVLALLGDVSFLHDIGALYAARDTGQPLAIVVIDNQGGRIFEQLPVFASMNREALAYWTTPHAFDLAAAGAVYGIAAVVPQDIESLQKQVRTALSMPHPTLIVIRVDPNSARVGAASLQAEIANAVVG